jgi:hypothetical protein
MVDGMVFEYYACHVAAAIGLGWPIGRQQKNCRLSPVILEGRR